MLGALQGRLMSKMMGGRSGGRQWLCWPCAVGVGTAAGFAEVARYFSVSNDNKCGLRDTRIWAKMTAAIVASSAGVGMRWLRSI